MLTEQRLSANIVFLSKRGRDPEIRDALEFVAYCIRYEPQFIGRQFDQSGAFKLYLDCCGERVEGRQWTHYSAWSSGEVELDSCRSCGGDSRFSNKLFRLVERADLKVQCSGAAIRDRISATFVGRCVGKMTFMPDKDRKQRHLFVR
ncbi:hypothetical protein C9I57_08455 [Trinickia symbiotica]|uniref:Uncharacterized protein n=1 Tax=Trinickia symbiotica TaxID=863227 RepID=A0A2T3XYQ9_9BURK|nr:hypothetical protein C9I57_08455 [Trinickia symbiotica]